MVYDKQTAGRRGADLRSLRARPNTYERVPYVLRRRCKYIVEQQADADIAAQMKAYDFHKVIDNSVVDRLVREHFFEQLFGAGVKAERTAKRRSRSSRLVPWQRSSWVFRIVARALAFDTSRAVGSSSAGRPPRTKPLVPRPKPTIMSRCCGNALLGLRPR